MAISKERLEELLQTNSTIYTIYAGGCIGTVYGSETEDIKYIVKMGTKYTPEHFAGLLKWLEVK